MSDEKVLQFPSKDDGKTVVEQYVSEDLALRMKEVFDVAVAIDMPTLDDHAIVEIEQEMSVDEARAMFPLPENGGAPIEPIADLTISDAEAILVGHYIAQQRMAQAAPAPGITRKATKFERRKMRQTMAKSLRETGSNLSRSHMAKHVAFEVIRVMTK